MATKFIELKAFEFGKPICKIRVQNQFIKPVKINERMGLKQVMDLILKKQIYIIADSEDEEKLIQKGFING